MKHLILGSSGQVGQYVVEALRNTGDDFIEWDIEIDPDKHDLRDSSDAILHLYEAVDSCDFVHFLAFDVGGSTYLKKYEKSFDFISNNMNIMNNVFTVLERTNKPFYFASSQMSRMNQSVYGRLKAVGESFTSSLENGISVHFWNIFGYETNPEKTHVITDFINSAITTGQILIKTSGLEKRDFTYGPDAANILYAITQNFTQAQECSRWAALTNHSILPVVSPTSKEISIRKLADMIALMIPGTEVYFTDKGDSVQDEFVGPKNHFQLLREVGLLPEHSSNFDYSGFTEFSTALEEMIARIRQDQTLVRWGHTG